MLLLLLYKQQFIIYLLYIIYAQVIDDVKIIKNYIYIYISLKYISKKNLNIIKPFIII